LCSELELDRDRARGWTIAQTTAWSDGDETSLDTVRWLLEDA
jgi:streptomycin 6-kinase